jgi:hypothetical protein
LKEGDDIEIEDAGPRRFETGRQPNAVAILARLRKYRGLIPTSSGSTGWRPMSAAEAFSDTDVGARGF